MFGLFAPPSSFSGWLFKKLDDKSTSKLIKNSNCLLISIGGNDLRLVQYKNSMDKDKMFEELIIEYKKNLQDILSKVRLLDDDLLLIFLGLYIPYDVPEGSDEINYITNWNYVTQQIVEQDKNTVFIPTYDLMKFNIKKYISEDQLHPKSEGYKVISERIVGIIKSKFLK